VLTRLPCHSRRTLGAGKENHEHSGRRRIRQDRRENLGPGISRGLVIALPEGKSEPLAGMADVSRQLTGLFQLLAGLSPITDRENRRPAPFPRGYRTLRVGCWRRAARTVSECRPGTPRGPVRTLEIERDADLPLALRAALDKGCAVWSAFTAEAGSSPRRDTRPPRSSAICQP